MTLCEVKSGCVVGCLSLDRRAWEDGDMELRDVGAAELARRLACGEQSVVEHIRQTLERIEERDPQLTAFSALSADALRQAKALDLLSAEDRARLPLFGVPVAIKEEIEVAGLVTTLGGRANSLPAPSDSEVVTRLRRAGAVIIGKTHMPEFGQSPYTEGEWGAVRNPFGPDLSPGGSSGGSAVAVSAGMVPLALGGDAGGSIRIPAAWTGIFGLKPSRGSVSTAPHPNLWHRLGTFGPLARSVEDLELAMQVIAHHSPSQVERPLRVGWTLDSCLRGITPEPQVADAVVAAAGILARQGHQVSRGSIRWAESPLTFMVQYHLGVLDEARRTDHPELLERRTRQVANIARMLPRAALTWAERSTARVEEAMNRVFKHIDVLLTPVTPTLPVPIRPIHRLGYAARHQISVPVIAYTSYWNIAGYPAASVPAGLSDEGLPLAVQVIAPIGADRLVLDVAHSLAHPVQPKGQP